jgi:hypothetical protein
MKITKAKLKQIIKEELNGVTTEARTHTVKTWKRAIYDPIDEYFEYADPTGEDARMVLQALEELVRDLKDKIRGDVR